MNALDQTIPETILNKFRAPQPKTEIVVYLATAQVSQRGSAVV